jgi:SAM-dependent methyltransferase
MPDWSAGYVLDIPYTSGFYRELSPAYLQFVALAQSIRPPTMVAGSTYCELACGQGFGTNLLAAANPHVRFWGMDFNPGQIANARRLAAAAGLKNVQFEDWSFEQAAKAPRDALPQFDVITLHGIYSWISPENRRFIVEFIEARLKPGGLVYVSYNCLPGWSSTAPLQRLMREHANRHPGRSDQQADRAVTFAKRLQDGGAVFFAGNPTLGPRLEKMPTLNKNYLAHEYLNGHWHPMYHLDVAREMEAARLTYIGSATLTENIDAISVPAALMPVLSESQDRSWQETIRDYASNKQFRRDVFIRGVNPIGVPELLKICGELNIVLCAPRSSVSLKFNGPLGEVTGQDEIYNPILDALAQRPRTVMELTGLPGMAGRPFSAVLQAVAMLLHGGHVQPMLREVSGQGTEQARAFNKAVIDRARSGDSLNWLACPLTGNGVPASFVEQMGLLALGENAKTTPQQAARFGWSIMAQTGQRIMKNGATLQTEEETIPELETQIATFFSEKLPLWKQLRII